MDDLTDVQASDCLDGNARLANIANDAAVGVVETNVGQRAEWMPEVLTLLANRTVPAVPVAAGSQCWPCIHS